MLKVGDVRYYIQQAHPGFEAIRFVVKFIGEDSAVGECGKEKKFNELLEQDIAFAKVDELGLEADKKQTLTDEMTEKMCLVQREVNPVTGEIAVMVCDKVDLTSHSMFVIGMRARLNPTLQYFYGLRETMKDEGIIEMIKHELDEILERDILVPVNLGVGSN